MQPRRTTSRLTPYVAYLSSESVDGLGTTNRVVVRVRDGRIVSGISHFDVNVGNGVRVANPVTAPIFDAACYRATRESKAIFEGGPAVKFDLTAICGERDPGDQDYVFTTLYAQPGSLRPIDANGLVPPDGESKYASVSMDQRFGAFAGYRFLNSP